MSTAAPENTVPKPKSPENNASLLQPESQPQSKPQPPNHHEGGDLIDFSDDPPPVVASPQPIATGAPTPGTNAALLSGLHLHNGDTHDNDAVKRQDTDSKEDEIFVDAED